MSYRYLQILLATIILWMGTGGVAIAGEELGEFCWRLEPFVDTLRLSVSTQGTLFHALAVWRAKAPQGNWTIGGTDTRPLEYEWFGTGVGREARPETGFPPGSIEFALTMNNIAGSFVFGGQPLCAMKFVITLPSLNAYYFPDCPTGPALPAFLTPRATFHTCTPGE